MFKDYKKAELKAVFLESVKFLGKQSTFGDISLSGEIMSENDKKKSYWATLNFSGIRLANQKRGHATIYLNLRDIARPEQVLQAIAHEANNLIGKGEDYYYNLLFENYLNTRTPL